MAIPPFDDDGNLPPGVHAAEEDEVDAALVIAFPRSRTRRLIYDYWRLHRDALVDLVEVERQLLAGSFTSDKPDPADADIITVIDGQAFEALPQHRQLMVRSLISGHYTESFWNCDSHPVLRYPEDHPGHSRALLVLERITDYFGHDREGRARGFVEVRP